MKKRSKRYVLILGTIFVFLGVISIFIELNPTGNVIDKSRLDEKIFGEVSGKITQAVASSEGESTTYIYVGTLAAKVKDNNIDYYVQDHLGSNMKVVDNSLVEQDNKYYAFGETSTT